MMLFTRLSDSLYNPGFYATMRERRTSAAFGHICVMAFLVAIGSTVYYFSALKGAQQDIAKAPESIAAMYPEQLVFNVTNGKASVMGMEEPITIPISESDSSMQRLMAKDGVTINDTSANELIGKNIVIDTKTPFSIEALKERDAFAWVGADGVYTLSNNGQIKGFSYGEKTNVTISRTQVTQVVEYVQPYMKLILPVLLICVAFGVFFGSLISYIFFSLIVAIITLIYYKVVLKNGIGYAHAFRTTAFAATIPFIAYTVMSYIPFYIPYFCTIATLLVLIANTYAHRKTDTVVQTQPPVVS